MSIVENAREQLLSSGSWSVDPAHSTIEFRVKHMMIQTVKGRFRDFDGAIVGGAEPSVSGSIRVASLETLHEERDAHLRSPDFFDAGRHPEIAFHAGGMQFNGDEAGFALAGELTIKGVTRPGELDCVFRGSGLHPDGGERIALKLSGGLNGADFGLVCNRALGGVLVGNTVELARDVSAIRVD